MGFSRHTYDRRASEGENGIELVTSRTRRRRPDARMARQRRDLISANVERRTVRFRVQQFRRSLTKAPSPHTSGRNQGSCPGSWSFVFWVLIFRQRVVLASSQSTASLPKTRSWRTWRGKLFVDRCRLLVTERAYRAPPCNQLSGSLSEVLANGQFHPIRGVASLMRTRCCTRRRTNSCMPSSTRSISIPIRHHRLGKQVACGGDDC